MCSSAHLLELVIIMFNSHKSLDFTVQGGFLDIYKGIRGGMKSGEGRAPACGASTRWYVHKFYEGGIFHKLTILSWEVVAR